MHMRWLARWLLPRLQDYLAADPPDFQVIRGEDRLVYLRRWWVIRRNRFFNVYLHNMILDDDATLHDHPYASLSLVLTDGLQERYCLQPGWDDLMRVPRLDGSQGPIELRMRFRSPRAGDLVYRSSRLAHQLIVKEPAWTLFVTGPRVREWGFWCPSGWRKWSDYVATDQDPSVRGNGVGSGTSGVGQGCGETTP